MKKTIILCIGIMILLITISGCNPVVREEESVGNLQSELKKIGTLPPSKLPERLSLEVSDSMVVEAKLDISHELSEYCAADLILTRQLFDPTQCVDEMLKLLGNPTVVNREVNGSEEYLENDKEMKIDEADLENDSWVQGRDLYFGMRDVQWKLPYEEPVEVEIEINSIFDTVPMNEDLSFEKADVICEKMDTLFKNLEIEDLLDLEKFSFTTEILQKWIEDNWYKELLLLGENAAQMEQPDMTDADSFYFIRYRQGYEGIPYYYYDNISDSVAGTYQCFGTEISVVYGAEGIISLDGGYLFHIKETGEKTEIKSLREMLEKFIDSHAMTGGNRVTVRRIGLSYLPILKDGQSLEFQAIPVWYFIYDVDFDSGDGAERKTDIYNAVTGAMYQ